MTFSITADSHHAECRYAECSDGLLQLLPWLIFTAYTILFLGLCDGETSYWRGKPEEPLQPRAVGHSRSLSSVWSQGVNFTNILCATFIKF